jgi:deoxyribodipyrimidine photo-lyase
MAASRVLFWHRRDLRLADNLGIQAAVEISPAVTGVYVLDPALIHPAQELPPMAPARLWFFAGELDRTAAELACCREPVADSAG